MDQNFNIAECIVKQPAWGETLITNICSGRTHVLPWQLGDWAAGFAVGGLLLFLGVIILVFMGMCVSVARGR